jgi:hypothetical protein
MTSDYPKRPKFFAFRFCRLMAKVCLANEIGADACWLLAVVAQCEDAKHYTSPVTYFNDHLAPLVGAGSIDALDRTRKKAVAAGWLDYTPGRKHVAGKYFVTIPPQFCGINDGAFDEDGSEYLPRNCGSNRGSNREETATQPGGKCGSNREETAEHSTLTLTLPFPVPNTENTALGNGKTKKQRKRRAVIAYSQDFEDFWKAYPNVRKQNKPEAFSIWPEHVEAVRLRFKIEEHDAVSWLVQRATEYAASQQGSGKYCRGPVPWLNQAGYDDEPESWRDGPPKQTTPRPMSKEECDEFNRTGRLPPDAFERLDA